MGQILNPKKSWEIFMQKSGGTERAFLLSFLSFFTFSALASLLQKVEKERELNGADLCNPLQGSYRFKLLLF